MKLPMEIPYYSSTCREGFYLIFILDMALKKIGRFNIQGVIAQLHKPSLALSYALSRVKIIVLSATIGSRKTFTFMVLLVKMFKLLTNLPISHWLSHPNQSLCYLYALEEPKKVSVEFLTMWANLQRHCYSNSGRRKLPMWIHFSPSYLEVSSC
jgi:hypothetical protein